MVSSAEVRKMKEEGDIEGLFVALEAEERWVREAALDALLKVGDEAARDRLLEQSHKKLAEADGEAADLAAIALGRLGSGKSVEPLLQVVEHQMPQVVRHAAEALGRIGDPRALEGLLPLLENGEKQVRAAAIEALGRLKDQRACPALLKRVEEPDLEEAELGLVLRALASLGEPQAGALAVKHLAHKNASVRQSAAILLADEAMAASLPRKEEAAAGLVGMLKEFKPAIRISACKALAVLGGEDALPALEHVRRTDTHATINPYSLEATQYEVQEEAERAIKKIQERLAG